MGAAEAGDPGAGAPACGQASFLPVSLLLPHRPKHSCFSTRCFLFQFVGVFGLFFSVTFTFFLFHVLDFKVFLISSFFFVVFCFVFCFYVLYFQCFKQTVVATHGEE